VHKCFKNDQFDGKKEDEDISVLPFLVKSISAYLLSGLCAQP
jgi:hypothetical protein